MVQNYLRRDIYFPSAVLNAVYVPVREYPMTAIFSLTRPQMMNSLFQHGCRVKIVVFEVKVLQCVPKAQC